MLEKIIGAKENRGYVRRIFDYIFRPKYDYIKPIKPEYRRESYRPPRMIFI